MKLTFHFTSIKNICIPPRLPKELVRQKCEAGCTLGSCGSMTDTLDVHTYTKQLTD